MVMFKAKFRPLPAGDGDKPSAGGTPRAAQQQQPQASPQPRERKAPPVAKAVSRA